jgi:hypothetical protein
MNISMSTPCRFLSLLYASVLVFLYIELIHQLSSSKCITSNIAVANATNTWHFQNVILISLIEESLNAPAEID